MDLLVFMTGVLKKYGEFYKKRSSLFPVNVHKGLLEAPYIAKDQFYHSKLLAIWHFLVQCISSDFHHRERFLTVLPVI